MRAIEMHPANPYFRGMRAPMHPLQLATLTAVAAYAEASNPTPAAELRITLYNHADVPAHVLEAASAGLRRIFMASGIEVRIIHGDPEAPEGVSVAYPSPLRPGLEREAACQARTDVALRITVGLPSQRSTILGMAVPFARKGLNVLVYDDRVRSVAAARAQAPGAVLAHAMAHEIGHVLLRSSGHDKIGIMSSAWTDDEYTRITQRTLIFSRKQAQAMQATLRGLACAQSGY